MSSAATASGSQTALQSLRPWNLHTPRPVSEQVVVVIGASSGIGRQTAIEFGRRGASVVLSARSEESLQSAASEVQAVGGTTRIIPADVAKFDQLERLAQEAASWRGRIDTWINDAAVSEYATFEEMTLPEIERILQVNLLGQIYGCKAVLPQVRRQGYGTIMNVGSIVGMRAIPLQSIYCATKFGIRGFTDSLRMELAHDSAGINVTLIMPPSTNTPFFNHARSKMGVKPMPLPPIYDVGIVARAIVFAAEHPRRDVLIGGASKMIEIMQRISPRLADWYLLQRDRGFKQQQSNQPDDPRDTLFHPVRGAGRTEGDFSDQAKSRSMYTPLDLRPGVKLAVGAGVAIGITALTARLLSRR
jgi:short-subunit dehydrogenase